MYIIRENKIRINPLRASEHDRERGCCSAELYPISILVFELRSSFELDKSNKRIANKIRTCILSQGGKCKSSNDQVYPGQGHDK